MEKSEKEVTLKKNRNTLVVISCFIIVCLSVRGYSLEPAPITPNDEFFVLHESPNIPDDWHLIVDGAVSQPLSLTLDDLARFTQTRRRKVRATLKKHGEELGIVVAW